MVDDRGKRKLLPIDPGTVPLQFGVSGFEWIIVLIILAALFLLGPKKIPELARSLGRAMGEFRRGRVELEREISREISGAESQSASSRIASAARHLGVDTTGRRDMELKLEIARKIEAASDSTVGDVARTLGVWESGLGPTRLKELIIKSLGV